MHRIEQAKRIIEPFMLRRLKADVLKSLPVKTLVINNVNMTEHQKTRYNTLVDEIKEASIGKEVTDNSHMMWLMMLRKLTNHPLLLRYHFEVSCKLLYDIYFTIYEKSILFIISG
jgi:SWI/SNF-related matrix-associated actin-dependent regulator of chromatin subfamily A containing DEAD/H box 1